MNPFEKNAKFKEGQNENVPFAEKPAADFIGDKSEIEDYLQKWRTGTFVKGLSTGLPLFDKFYLFKRGNYNVFNGYDNVGKSTTLWYLNLLSAILYDWKWIIYSNENRNGTVIKRLIEFYCCEKIEKIEAKKYLHSKNFIDEHFTIIRNDKLFNYRDLLLVADKINDNKKHDGLLIDPYNSLIIDLAYTSKLNTHEYHYEAASEMQLKSKRDDMCIYLNCHVITNAMREKRVPGKADTEGGVKFANKADDFATIHREVQNREEWMKTQIHVRKIKEIETGGGYTPMDQPFILKMIHSGCGFEDSEGFNPIYSLTGTKAPVDPNLNGAADFKMKPTESEHTVTIDGITYPAIAETDEIPF